MGRKKIIWTPRPIEITPFAQLYKLRNLFPDGKCKIIHDGFEWEYKATPTPNSREYKLKIVYHKHRTPAIFVVSPNPLAKTENANELPHVYDDKKQQICLYYGAKEYNNTMYLIDTIVPWASEWLMYYELWLATGKWLGGGIEHNSHPKVLNNDR